MIEITSHIFSQSSSRQYSDAKTTAMKEHPMILSFYSHRLPYNYDIGLMRDGHQLFRAARGLYTARA
jgi:hypothetical protein